MNNGGAQCRHRRRSEVSAGQWGTAGAAGGSRGPRVGWALGYGIGEEFESFGDGWIGRSI